MAQEKYIQQFRRTLNVLSYCISNSKRYFAK